MAEQLSRTGLSATPFLGVVAVSILMSASQRVFAQDAGDTHPSREKPLIAPGRDTDAVVSVLRKIIEGHEAGQKPLKNILIRGRVSYVRATLAPGADPESPVNLPAPDWHPFTLVHKGGRRRFEIEVVDDKSDLSTTYRILNDEAFYAMNPKSLEIAPIKDPKRDWSDFIYSVSAPLEVCDGVRYVPLAVCCQTHVDRLIGQADSGYFQKFREELHCYEEGELLVVEHVTRPDADPDRAAKILRFWVDRSAGYQLVKSAVRKGSPGGGLYSTRDCQIDYSQIAPGVFVLNKATISFASLGTAAQNRGGAGWGRRDVEVESVSFGDFDYPDSQFDPKSLPIPIGAPVTDWRTDPPLTFIFGREPLDEQLLAQARLRKPTLPEADGLSRGQLILIVANAVAFVAVLIFILLRATRHASSGEAQSNGR